VVLAGADGAVFVADSLAVRRRKKIESLRELLHNLYELRLAPGGFPLVLQYDKRDLQGGAIPLRPLELMGQDLNPQRKFPSLAARAVMGQGVMDTPRAVTKKVATAGRPKALFPPGVPPPISSSKA
jgi:hypothetical protein